MGYLPSSRKTKLIVLPVEGRVIVPCAWWHFEVVTADLVDWSMMKAWVVERRKRGIRRRVERCILSR